MSAPRNLCLGAGTNSRHSSCQKPYPVVARNTFKGRGQLPWARQHQRIGGRLSPSWLPPLMDEAHLHYKHARFRSLPTEDDAEALPDSNGSSLGHEVEVVAVLQPDVSVEEEPWRWRWGMLAQIARFGLPALAIPLADPLMSLVDTVCVAQYSGTLELAALGPCTLIFNFVTYVFNSLSVTTVSVVADRIARGRYDSASRAVSTSIFLAAVSGLTVCVVLTLFGSVLIGATGCDPALVPVALSYLQIRALAAPAVLISMVAQASVLAQKDSVTPFVVVLLTGAINVAGDILLIGRMGMGLVGAAWATAGSQVLGAMVLLSVLRLRSKAPPYLYIPAWHEVKAMGGTLGPLGLMYLCKNTCYVLIQGHATRMTTLLLAAHQPMWTLWNLCAFCNTPLEQAALAFMPAARSETERRELAKVVVACGIVVGITVSCISSGLPSAFPRLFTPDTQLWPLMRSIAPQGIIALIFAGLDVSSSAILMSRRDYVFLARAMLASLGALLLYLGALHVWGPGAPNLAATWWGLVVFFGARAVQSMVRMAIVQFGARESGGGGSEGGSAKLSMA